MKAGDRVLVPFLGELRRARVVHPVTALGNVDVALEEPVFDPRLAPVAIERLVRAPSDVVTVDRPDPTRVVREWETSEPGPIGPDMARAIERYESAERDRLLIIDDPPAPRHRAWRRRHNRRRLLDWYRSVRS